MEGNDREKKQIRGGGRRGEQVGRASQIKGIIPQLVSGDADRRLKKESEGRKEKTSLGEQK